MRTRGDGRRPGRARAADSGVSLVEFAIIMPVLFMILIGMITGGITLSRQNSVENAVREGTRFGAVNALGDPKAPFTYLGQVIDAAKNAATDDLGDGVAGKQICAALVHGGKSWKIVEDAAGTRTQSNSDPGQASRCFEDNRLVTEDRVQVTAQRTSEIEGVFFSHSITLSSRSVTRYER